MTIWKFKDNVDGNYAFILAKTKDEAAGILMNLTSIPFEYVDKLEPDHIKKPFIILNKILPF